MREEGKSEKTTLISDANIITSFPFAVLIFDYAHFDIKHIIYVGCRQHAPITPAHSTQLKWAE